MNALPDILTSSFTLALCLLVPGSVWYRFRAEKEPFRPGRCLACGLLILLLAGLTLALGGVFLKGNLLALLFVFSLPVIGGKVLKRLLVPLLLLTLLLTAVRILPGQSQWLAGGWDPGTYLNSGILLARHQTPELELGAKPPLPPKAIKPITVEPVPPLAGRAVPSAFLYSERDYQEVFPGFPYVNEGQTPSTHMYFFKLQEVWIAFLYHLGGVDMAAQSGLIAGLLGLIIWGSLLFRLWGPWAAGCGVALFLLHPIWIYHLDLPLPELLQITLMGALLLFVEENARPETKNRPWMLALILFLMTTNRVTFFLFGSWWLAFYAATREMREGETDWTLLWCMAALAGGLYIDLTGSPYALRLQHLLPRMIQAGCGGWLMAGCIWAARHKGKLTPQLALVLPMLILFLAGLRMGRADGLSGLWMRLGAFIDFSGRIYVLLFAVCLIIFLMQVWRKPTTASAFGLWLMMGAWMWWNYPHAANLYPWATRRMLLFAVPLGVFVMSGVVSMTWNRASKSLPWIGQASFLSMMLLFLFLQTPNVLRAWQPQEFAGVRAQLALAADHIPNRGVVVSDHFRWAVPLWSLHDRFMLNGDNFRQADEAAQHRAINWLANVQSEGYAVHLVTSTDAGPDYLGDLPGTFELVWEGEPFTYQQLQHHAQLRRYALEDVTKEFRVYRWVVGGK